MEDEEGRGATRQEAREEQKRDCPLPKFIDEVPEAGKRCPWDVQEEELVLSGEEGGEIGVCTTSAETTTAGSAVGGTYSGGEEESMEDSEESTVSTSGSCHQSWLKKGTKNRV